MAVRRDLRARKMVRGDAVKEGRRSGQITAQRMGWIKERIGQLKVVMLLKRRKETLSEQVGELMGICFSETALRHRCKYIASAGLYGADALRSYVW